MADLRPRHRAARRPARSATRQRRGRHHRRLHPHDGRPRASQLFERREPATPGEVALEVEGSARAAAAPSDPHATVLNDIVARGARAARSSASPGWSARGAPSCARDLRRRSVRPRRILRRRQAGRASARRATRSRTASASCPRTASSRRCSSTWRSAQKSAIAALGRILQLGVLRRRARPRRALVERLSRALNIRMAGAGPVVGNLSGGNQQKVVLARWLALRPKVLIVDEPTRGIDVGAKAEVHQLLDDMARAGHRGDRDLLRAAGGAGDQRPHRHHARGPDHRRDAARRGDARRS